MNTEQEGIKSAITARVRSFETAECARDAEGLVAHYAAVPSSTSITMAGVRPVRPCQRVFARRFPQSDPST